MTRLPFSIVDVFSSTPYKGNPLAIIDNTSNTLTDTQMKLIARQFNLSETTFFQKPQHPSADFCLRSFLPDGREVFGAGHNILGVWWYLAASGKLQIEEKAGSSDGKAEQFVFRQELGGNVSTVIIEKKNSPHGEPAFSVSVRQATPQAHAEHPDVPSLAQSIGLARSDIGFTAANGKSLKPQVMSTSTTRHLMVPVSTAEVLNKVQVQKDKLLEQLALVDEKSYGIYIFTPTGEQGNYQARFFSPGMSGEDPATGSAAGPLSKYLYLHGDITPVNNTGRITVRQGLLLGRECIIDVVLTTGGESDEVDVVGTGVVVMDGEIKAPDASVEF